LFLCLRCKFDPNMVIEFSSHLSHLTLDFPTHISIRNLLLHYLDIHQPINKYMIDLLKTILSPERIKEIQEFCEKHTSCNIINILRTFEDVTLPLNLLSEMFRQVQNFPLRIISHDASEGLITFIHDINFRGDHIHDHSNYIIHLKPSEIYNVQSDSKPRDTTVFGKIPGQEVQLYFERTSMEIPYDDCGDVVLIADRLGAYSVVNMLEHVKERRIDCNVTVFVEADDEIIEKLASVESPWVTIHQQNSIFRLLKDNAVWIRKMILTQDSFVHINTSDENVHKMYNIFIQSLCPFKSTSGEDLDLYAIGRALEQFANLQKKDNFITYIF